ncbi:MAG TPA: Wzz/FepE/Etk N-terminal domain-containing protein [Candidatus Acidoferrales bacterium]|nr:Wzz/FepE/Etk N-terminal domain-containing protein [Candidatus Acidoferrales bacterium]
MNNTRPVETPAGMSLGDIYYIVFRHKWKIIFASLMGFLAAAAIYHFKPPAYQSQAELLIKYVSEPTQLEIGGDNKVLVPDSQGDDIINSEIQILTSLDVAEEAATNFGAANILAKVGGGNSVYRAARLIRSDIEAEPADSRSSIITVTLKHPDPQIVQPLLLEVINDYLVKHYEIHSTGGQVDDALTMEVSTLNVQLNATEQQIADLKNKANVTSVEDSQKDVAAQISKIRDEILDAQVELSGSEAAMKQTSGNQSLEQVATNNVQPVIPSIEVDAYARITASLDAFRKKESDYLVQGFTHSNSLVQAVDEQIADAEKSKSDLEKKYPRIGNASAISTASTGSMTESASDPNLQMANVAALQAKIKSWSDQLVQLQMQATNLNNLAPTMAQLEQTESIEKANYQNLSIKLEDNHIDESLDTGKTPNIRWVQRPSPPGRDWKKTYKAMATVAFGGFFAGLAWAFVIEMFLDRSVRRPVEVKTKLKLPFFLSIPDVRRNGHAKLSGNSERRLLQLKNGEGSDAGNQSGVSSVSGKGALQVASLERNRSLQPFYEALRDRLIVYFEVKNLTHKPKLVAVTAAHQGAGVSTVAAGLAASLSATGDGNVLLVDMNLENGAAQRFYKGKAICGLDTALKRETREEAMVHENLYVVNGNAESGLPNALPKRFSLLIPSLKAMDYDYIIFDLPPVSPTSITSRLAKFMDMTLLVLESEKTNLEVVQQANTWLAESGATVGVVLNKTHQYVPSRLNQEFLSDR